jgi:phosphate transport system permease protein
VARRVSGLAVYVWGVSLATGAMFLALVSLVVRDSLPAWRHEGFWGLLTGAAWHYRAEAFGALPMIYGTLVVAAVALLLAAPVGLAAAVFTAEVLPPRARLGVKAALELLAGVPSVVYGLLGVLVLRDVMYDLLEPLQPLSGDSLVTAGVLLAVMVLPTFTTFADDALSGVPGSQRAAARALGMTRAETLTGVVLPRAWPGVLAAALLALGRALGETIAVFLVVGRQDNRLPVPPGELAAWVTTWIDPGQTLTSKLGGSETFLAYGEPLHWSAMMALAVILLALTGLVAGAGVLLGRGRLGAPRR